MIEFDTLFKKCLDLAIKGKLVPQDPSDEPASELLKKIKAEKEQLIKDRKIKKDKNESTIFRGKDGLFYETIGEETKCIQDEIPFDIPDSWEWCKLGTTLLIERGGSPRPIEKFLTNDEFGINWIKIGDSEKGNKYITSTKEKIIKEGVNRSRFVVKGDIILSNSMSFGRPYILDINGCIHDGWLVMHQYIKIYDNEFLFYALSSPFVMKQFKKKVAGGIVSNLNKERVSAIYFPIPPLAEQKRIVEKLEEIKSNVELGKNAYTEITKEITPRLKKKVLDLAIKGKLVPQDPNDEPASELLKKIKAEKEQLIKDKKIKNDKNESTIFRGREGLFYENIGNDTKCIQEEIPFEIPDSWEWCRLKTICSKIVDGDHNPPKDIGMKTDYLMISAKNIFNNSLWNLDDVRYLSEVSYNEANKRTFVERGDILLTIVGTLGRSCIYQSDLNICFQRSVCIIKTHAFNLFLKNIFDSSYIQNTMQSTSKGTAQRGFYLQQVEQLLLPLPPLSEQKRIVEEIEKVYSKIALFDKQNLDN